MRQNVYETRTPQVVLQCRLTPAPGQSPPPLRLQCTASSNNYYTNTPLWSVPYRYCRSDADCKRNTVDDKRCLPMLPDTSSCDAPGSCICTNAVWAAL